MKDLVEMIVKETGLSRDQAEKVVMMVKEYLTKPLSERTMEDLSKGDVSKNDLSDDKQPFTIP